MMLRWKYSFLIICILCLAAIINTEEEEICSLNYLRCEIRGLGNQLTVIPYSASRYLQESMVVKIRYYKISVWYDVLLKSVPNIKYIDLQYNYIESMQSNVIFNFPNLTSLDLRNNQIKTIPLNMFMHSIYLKRLYLSYNNLTSFESIFDVKNSLEELYLENNNLIHINGISKFSLLKILRVDKNNISVLPHSELNQLILLLSLNLSHNKISDTNKNCSIRVSINLNYNNNRLTKICKLSGGIKNANFLKNNISKVENVQLSEAKELFNLDLSQNQITILESNSFEGSENLGILNISSNQINKLPLTIFHRQIHLHILDLSHNKLEFLEYGIFTSLNSLQELHLSYNNFGSLNLNVFYSLKRLYILNLLGNPLHDLDLEKLLKFNNELSILYINLTDLDCEKYIKYEAVLTKKSVSHAILTHTGGKDKNCSDSTENITEKSTQLQKIESVLNPLLKLHITLTIFAVLLLIYLILIIISFCQKSIRHYDK